MNALKECISKTVAIDEERLKNISEVFEERELSKGTFFLESGKQCLEMAFIASGYLRMYNLIDGKEITLWIGGESRFITSVSSFELGTTNFWNIQAITDCTLYVISRNKHRDLCKTEPKWLEFDNVLLVHAFSMLEQKMFDQLHTTAIQRLEKLYKEDPKLFNEVPHHYIASMLGITPESLSRLRKTIVKSFS